MRSGEGNHPSCSDPSMSGPWRPSDFSNRERAPRARLRDVSKSGCDGRLRQSEGRGGEETALQGDIPVADDLDEAAGDGEFPHALPTKVVRIYAAASIM